MGRFLSSFAQHRLLGGAAVLALTQFGASLAGLLRDRFLAQTFPDLRVVDVYIAAFRPSDLLFQITVMSALGTVLVPFLASYKAKGQDREMVALLSSAMAVGGLVFGALALLMSLVFPWIAPALVQFQGPDLTLYVQFGRLALLTNALFVFGNALGQYLITIQRYWIYGVTPILYTAGTIVGTLFLTEHVGPLGPMMGTVLGAIIYTALRAASVLHHFRKDTSLPFLSFLPFLPSRFLHPDLRAMGWLMLPRIAALGAMQFELLLFDALASGLTAGAVTVNAYARNFQSVVIGVLGIALAQSAFSPLSQAAARGERERFRLYLRKGFRALLALSIPSVFALAAFAPLAAWLVHLDDERTLFRSCLSIYALSIPFESLNHLLQRGCYALKDTFLPAVFMSVNALLAIAIAWVLLPMIGVLSLPVGFTVGSAVQVVGLSLLLPRKIRRLSG